MPVLDVYVVHLSNGALGVLAYILGACILREQKGCGIKRQDNGLGHILFTSCDVTRVPRQTAALIVFKAQAKGLQPVDQERSDGPAYRQGALHLFRCPSTSCSILCDRKPSMSSAAS